MWDKLRLFSGHKTNSICDKDKEVLAKLNSLQSRLRVKLKRKQKRVFCKHGEKTETLIFI